MTIGEIIQEYQDRKHISTKKLAEYWGVTPSYVNAIKRGQRQPGNKIWRNAQKNTHELYVALVKTVFGGNKPKINSPDNRGPAQGRQG